MMKPILPILVFLACKSTAQVADTAFAATIYQHRQAYKAEFLHAPRSPLGAQDTAWLDFFPPEPAWKIRARLLRTTDALPFDLPTYSGRTAQYRQYAELVFDYAGKTYTLAIYQNLRLLQMPEYQDYLFLPFKDHTNAVSTYGGGRYLDFRLKEILEADGESWLWLDFNKCYNPYCAYSDGYNCPIPPPENHLPFEVPAGERNFKGEKKH